MKNMNKMHILEGTKERKWKQEDDKENLIIKMITLTKTILNTICRELENIFNIFTTICSLNRAYYLKNNINKKWKKWKSENM